MQRLSAIACNGAFGTPEVTGPDMALRVQRPQSAPEAIRSFYYSHKYTNWAILPRSVMNAGEMDKPVLLAVASGQRRWTAGSPETIGPDSGSAEGSGSAKRSKRRWIVCRGTPNALAEEGNCYLPLWVLNSLSLDYGDVAIVSGVEDPPQCEALTLQPVTQEVSHVRDTKKFFTSALATNFSTLQIGTVIPLPCSAHYDRNFFIVTGLGPAPVASLVFDEGYVEFNQAPPLESAPQLLECGVAEAGCVERDWAARYDLKISKRSESLLVELECTEGDADIYMCTEGRPTRTCHDWRGVDVGNTFIFLHVGERTFPCSFSIAVYGVSSLCSYTIRCSAGNHIEAPQLYPPRPAIPVAEKGMMHCKTCGVPFSQSQRINKLTHEARCGRGFLVRCKKCGMTMPKEHEKGHWCCGTCRRVEPRNHTHCERCEQNNRDNGTNDEVIVLQHGKEKHEEIFHKLIRCQACEREFQLQEFQMHRVSCHHSSTCRYCFMLMDGVNAKSHEERCGSRTMECDECGQRMLIREEKSHTCSQRVAVPSTQPDSSIEAPVSETAPDTASSSDSSTEAAPSEGIDERATEEGRHEKLTRDGALEEAGGVPGQKPLEQERASETGSAFGDYGGFRQIGGESDSEVEEEQDEGDRPFDSTESDSRAPDVEDGSGGKAKSMGVASHTRALGDTGAMSFSSEPPDPVRGSALDSYAPAEPTAAGFATANDVGESEDCDTSHSESHDSCISSGERAGAFPGVSVADASGHGVIGGTKTRAPDPPPEHGAETSSGHKDAVEKDIAQETLDRSSPLEKALLRSLTATTSPAPDRGARNLFDCPICSHPCTTPRVLADHLLKRH